MKNVLNAVSAILIILFFGWQFCWDCCETKCDKSDKKECDYSEWEKSGATKCKSYETKKECPHANIADGDGDDADGDDIDLDDGEEGDGEEGDGEEGDGEEGDGDGKEQ